MSKTIIVALDGSDNSEKIVTEAIFQAQTHHASLLLITVIDRQAEVYPDEMGVLPDLESSLVESSRATLLSICREMTEDEVECACVVHRGEHPHTAIIDEAKKHQAIMIIMGSHGRSQLMHMLMGSVTEKVIGQATCPVLVVSLRKDEE